MPPAAPKIILTLTGSAVKVVMNEQGEQKARKPSKALAKAKAGGRIVHPLRHGPAAHEKPLQKMRGNSARIHEEANRCDDSLQNCSELSGELKTNRSRRLQPRKGYVWLASTLARLCNIRASRKELCDWVRQAHALLNPDETHPKSGGRLEPISETRTGSASWSGEKTHLTLRLAGNGADAASASVQAVATPWRSDRPRARKIPKKQRNERTKEQ